MIKTQEPSSPLKFTEKKHFSDYTLCFWFLRFYNDSDWCAPKNEIKVNIKCQNRSGYHIKFPLTENVKDRSKNRGFFIGYPLTENVKNLSKSKVLYRIAPYRKKASDGSRNRVIEREGESKLILTVKIFRFWKLMLKKWEVVIELLVQSWKFLLKKGEGYYLVCSCLILRVYIHCRLILDKSLTVVVYFSYPPPVVWHTSVCGVP